MTVKQFEQKLAQEQFDKKNHTVVVDLPNGETIDVTNIYLDAENKQIRIAVEADATVEDEDFQ